MSGVDSLRAHPGHGAASSPAGPPSSSERRSSGPGNGEDTLDGIIVRVEKERKLGYVWGWSYHEWEIEDGDDGCRYTFVHNGQTDRGLDANEEGLPPGWHQFFDRLDDHLEGVSRSEDEGNGSPPPLPWQTWM